MKKPLASKQTAFLRAGSEKGRSALGRRISIVLHCIVSLLTLACLRAGAQELGYTYDLSGNLLSLSTINSLGVSLTAQPQSQLLEANAPIAFSVVAAGPGISYQWLSNGVPIAGATGDSLVLNNLSGTNFASYSVIVRNASGVVTSAPAAIWPDSNGTGMPDWWQMQYFGNLNQLPTGDFDNDGVDNLDEYLEGTNPANAASYNPRLYVQSLHGYVVASPAQPYYTMGQVVTLTAIPDSGQTFTGWIGDGSGPKPVISLLMNSHKSITATFGLPLPLALDNTNLVWTTGGSDPWYGQTEFSEDGVGAAQSGFIAYGEQSWLQAVTNLAEPMQLGFWWNVSSQPPDGLAFTIDGVTLASISGLSAVWQYVQTNLAAGPHTLLWTYSKTGFDYQNESPSVFLNVPWVDAGWVDEVVLTPLNAQTNAPFLSIELLSTNAVLISWPASSTGFALQQSSALGTTNWVDATNPVNVVGGQNQVNVTPATSNQFFRLKSS